MARPQPDLSGFREAQDDLRARFGVSATFRTPVAPEYPPGTVLDPETGAPMDVLLTAVETFDDVAVQAQFIRGVEGASPERSGVLGQLSEGEAVLIVGTADFASIEDATFAVVFGETYTIRSIRPDGLGATAHRYIVHLEASA